MSAESMPMQLLLEVVKWTPSSRQPRYPRQITPLSLGADCLGTDCLANPLRW